MQGLAEQTRKNSGGQKSMWPFSELGYSQRYLGIYLMDVGSGKGNVFTVHNAIRAQIDVAGPMLIE